MRLLLALLLLAVPAMAQPKVAEPAFNLALASSVFSSGLSFTAPRTIEAVTVPQLTFWGLQGVTALDTGLTVQLRDGAIALDVGGKAQFQRGAPPLPTADGWGAAAADVFAAAWEVSPALRQAGTQALMSAFFDEVFNHLDPYSRYVPPGAADADRAHRSGEAGAGLALVRRGGLLVVDNVNADGPAGEAGIVVGDRIGVVDGRSTQGASAATVMGWLAGPEGTLVKMAVRGRDGRIRVVDVERAVTPPETVYADRSGEVLALRITSFSADTGARLARELDTAFGPSVAPARRPRGLVLDLRGNRGGLLRQAVVAAGLLLDAGLITVTEGRNPNASHRWEAASGDATGGVPVIVAVDGRTASAAEILAAALSDDGRAVVVGSSTLGKGLVQTIGTLPDGGELFVTWSRVLAPRGWPIQGLGVLPQVCTSLGQDDLALQLSSLDRGVQRLRAALDRHRASRIPVAPAMIVEQRNACPAGEPREGDMLAAHYLLEHPNAYAAALLGPDGTPILR
ncbi:MAG: S41 family peptidase [Janthinobacterium lividum]